MSKLLLLISDKQEDLAFSEEVASKAGLTLTKVVQAKEGAQFILENDVHTIFVDGTTEELYLAFESAIQETVGMFSDRVNANGIYFFSSNDLENVSYLTQSPIFGHFILRTSTDPRGAGKFYSRIVQAVQQTRAFGIKQLLPSTAQVQVNKLVLSSQKKEAVEAVKSYLIQAQFQSRMAATIANAVDELLMNAIFDAPIDEIGKPLYSTTARSTVLNLTEKSEVELHIGFDGEYVVISAIDLYGSLDKAKLLSHISKKYDKEEYKVRTSIAGAGIGLSSVFHSGGSLLFVSESRVRTEVIVFFKKAGSFREFRDQFRFLSTQFYF